MSRPPYAEARRVFWIVDNDSAHRGPRSMARLPQRYGNLVLVHGPVLASWLNQMEIYFSILQRKALVPNDIQSLEELEERLLVFQSYYEQIAQPGEWRFTRRDLIPSSVSDVTNSMANLLIIQFLLTENRKLKTENRKPKTVLMICCIKLTCPWHSQNASRHREKYVTVFMNHCTKWCRNLPAGPHRPGQAGGGESRI
ncbi:MAG: hypothetical protein FJ126_05135 [Deltaproteobacteria bacterium]|nr:hypothetical protein [Deltaproteobacteria bacterium]